MKILCVIPCLESELHKHKESLLRSMGKLEMCIGADVNFIVVIQPNIEAPSRAQNKIDHTFFDPLKYVSVVNLICRSVSRARNVGLEFAIKSQFSHVYFHDVSIELCLSTCTRFKFEGLNPFLAYSFTPKFLKPNTVSYSNPSPIKLNVSPLYKPYVWSYLLPLQLIGDIRFNENIGPGDGTYYKSGEDLLFLYDVLSKTNFSVIHNAAAIVFHPPRDKYFSKHTDYALGQGYTLKIILKKYKRLADIFYVFLFFGNAIFRCLLRKPNSMLILKYRIYGFIQDSNKSQL